MARGRFSCSWWLVASLLHVARVASAAASAHGGTAAGTVGTGASSRGGTGASSSAAAGRGAFDVLVYGSTPSGVMAAVAAARHGAKTALLSQRAHVGGVCAGGLGQSDIGSCADEVIGGLALEFFQSSARRYATPQPRAPGFVGGKCAHAGRMGGFALNIPPSSQ